MGHLHSHATFRGIFEMTLQIGQIYETNDGTHIKIISSLGDDGFLGEVISKMDAGKKYCYDKNGVFVTSDSDHPLSIPLKNVMPRAEDIYDPEELI